MWGTRKQAVFASGALVMLLAFSWGSPEVAAAAMAGTIEQTIQTATYAVTLEIGPAVTAGMGGMPGMPSMDQGRPVNRHLTILVRTKSRCFAVLW